MNVRESVYNTSLYYFNIWRCGGFEMSTKLGWWHLGYLWRMVDNLPKQ